MNYIQFFLNNYIEQYNYLIYTYQTIQLKKKKKNSTI